MTTIATNGLIVAADTLVCVGTEKVQYPVRKILRSTMHPNRVYGFAGNPALMQSLIDWYEEGHALKDVPTCQAGTWQMIVCEPSSIMYLCDEAPIPFPVTWPFAIGTGGDFAVGAMDAGADPIQAVKIASGRDRGTGGAIMHLSIEELQAAMAAE